MPPFAGSTPVPRVRLQRGAGLCVTQGASALESVLIDRASSPAISLPQTHHEYNGKFHPVQKALSQKANIYRWKVFTQSNTRAGEAGLHSHARKENPANCCALCAGERRRELYGEQTGLVDGDHLARVPFRAVAQYAPVCSPQCRSWSV